MKDLMFLFPLLGVMIIYYLFIAHIDKCVGAEEALFSEKECVSKDVLLYKNVGDIAFYLKENHLDFDVTDYPSFPKLCFYKIVLGISENDLDNLLICKIAKHFDADVRTVAKCNLKVYHEIFDCEEVDVVISNIDEVKSILDGWEITC